MRKHAISWETKSTQLSSSKAHVLLQSSLISQHGRKCQAPMGDVSDRWDGLPEMSSRPSCRTTRESNSSTSPERFDKFNWKMCASQKIWKRPVPIRVFRYLFSLHACIRRLYLNSEDAAATKPKCKYSKHKRLSYLFRTNSFQSTYGMGKSTEYLRAQVIPRLDILEVSYVLL